MTFWGPYLLLQHSPDDGESGIVFRNARMGCVQHLSLIRTQGSEGEGDHAKRESGRIYTGPTLARYEVYILLLRK